MFASKILLLICVTTTIASIHAKIPYNEIGAINIFDNSSRDFEHRTVASIELVKNFFEREDVLFAISAGIVGIQFAPYVNKFAKIVPLIWYTLAADQSEWRSVFTKTIASDTMHSVTESEINWMEASIRTIQTKIKLLGDDNFDIENRRTIASIIHTDLVRMINLFDLNSSLLRKYTLLGAPPLIQLASLVAIFNPLMHSLNPLEAKNPDISCKIHDVLLGYRPRVVNARLRALHTKMSSFKSRVEVILLPYNANGYNETNPGEIDCKKDCKPDAEFPFELCFEDKFSSNSFNISKDHTDFNGTSVCVENYARFVRHRVEKLFPIELMDKLCIDRKPKTPTGFGWFTINVQQVYVYGRNNGRPCNLDWTDGCDASIKLFVNGELMLETPKLVKQFSFDADITFTTAKIRKNSTIKIEIWHIEQGYWGNGLIQSVEGNIESFLNEPLRQGDHFYKDYNRLETMSFWRDELQ